MAKILTDWDVHQLKGAPVISGEGLLLGRLDGLVHHSDGRLSALVVRRRWSRPGLFRTLSHLVRLEGAEIRRGAIHLDPLAAYLTAADRPAAALPTAL